MIRSGFFMSENQSRPSISNEITLHRADLVVNIQ